MIGAAALGALLLLALAVRYIAGIRQENWGFWWSLAFGLGICVTFFMAIYDPKNCPKTNWDFNPKRGFLYFLLGWMIFPLGLAIRTAMGGSFTLGAMFVFTFAMSVLIGIVGTFTKDVGV
ncbi:hypothetical protein OK349_13185 [Sphingomonas sp. BT-65]|uniref:hypothetical protein n=1 Tax=Sphingomonas sp. BT-65 TaxID=2989821 RepID=UPI0022355A86|nr:hypothetical protein [Sphingomonas sp. BT-65]MCW4462665.1 hypothetical protein [Sphingomonas sp. BT-65]